MNALKQELEMLMEWEEHFTDIGLYALADETQITIDKIIQEIYKLEEA
nr:MAG TPA: hypothetical protein [Caudoviricetes sp.]